MASFILARWLMNRPKRGSVDLEESGLVTFTPEVDAQHATLVSCMATAINGLVRFFQLHPDGAARDMNELVSKKRERKKKEE
jgi:hypothetical protein